MTLEERLDELAKLTCPKQVDVVDEVMRQIAQQPRLQPASRAVAWRQWGAIAAAAAVTLLIVNIAIFQPRRYNDSQLGSMIAQVNDYASYTSWGTIEEAAMDLDTYLDE